MIDRIRCHGCGIPIPDPGQDSADPDHLLCDDCHDSDDFMVCPECIFGLLTAYYASIKAKLEASR